MKRTLAFLLAAAIAPFAAAQFSAWTVSEMQPDIAQGGRANTIAVHPVNNDIILVASESGGLFRSINHGATWSHVEGLPEYGTSAVAYLAADPRVVIATVVRDYRAVNGGGIWRSADGGTTWTQAAPPPAPPCGQNPFCVPEALNAYEISIAPDTGNVYVATTFGVSYGADRGVTWTHVNPFGSADRHTFSVLALQNGVVLAGGIAGIRRSTDGGATWTAPAAWGGGMITDIHAFTRSPYWVDQAYVVNDNQQLFYTENGGNSWTRITAAPGPPPPPSACGGIAFVKALASPRIPPVVPNPPDQSLLLWYGNRCSLYTLYCPALGARSFNYSGTWATMNVDHSDTRDLAFESGGRALLLGTDGGLHKTPDGGTNWSLAGGGRNGYNALQLTEVKGQAIAAPPRYDLYLGTQDNHLWTSPDMGRTWTSSPSGDGEGFYLEREHRVPRPADSKITFVGCGIPCVDEVSDALFANEAPWPDAQSPNPAGNPKFVGRSLHVQGVDDRSAAFSKGFAYSTNLGLSWSQYATMTEPRLSMPKLSQPGSVPVLYQPIRVSSTRREIHKLARIARRVFFPTAFVTYPLMNHFGGLGVNPTMFAWYEVFDVDPGNTRHLIAPDAINGRMKESWDAGDNWTDMPALTSLVTDSGRFLFSYDKDNVPLSHASVVSFNHDNPNLAAVGTQQAGILVSSDRGATWARVAGSERATWITAIEWKSASEAIISTYGRGLWRMTTRFVLGRPQFDTYCKTPCTIQPFAKADPNETSPSAILAFNGRILGGRAANGVLQELFVTPASSVVLFADTGVKITESDQDSGFDGATPPATPAGTSLVGVTLGKSGNLLSAAFTNSPLVMYEPTDVEKNQDNDPIGGAQSPNAGLPLLSLGVDAANSVMPGASLKISGSGFAPSMMITITLDAATAAKVNTGDAGSFALTIAAPASPGLHAVGALDPNGAQIDTAAFVVRHADGGP